MAAATIHRNERIFTKGRTLQRCSPSIVKPEAGGTALYDGPFPSIPTLAVSDKPSSHYAAKSPCRIHSPSVDLDVANYTRR